MSQEKKVIDVVSRRVANDKYLQCTGTDHYYRHSFGHQLTDGAMMLCQDYQCFWLMDVITSYQIYPKFQAEGFQVWKLERVKGDKFKVTADDGNGYILCTQVIPFSDFKDDEVKLFLIDKVIMLPTEY